MRRLGRRGVAFVSRYEPKEDHERHRDEAGADDAAEERLERGERVVVIPVPFHRSGLGRGEVVERGDLGEEEEEPGKEE
jgi:hypothetical protein